MKKIIVTKSIVLSGLLVLSVCNLFSSHQSEHQEKAKHKEQVSVEAAASKAATAAFAGVPDLRWQSQPLQRHGKRAALTDKEIQRAVLDLSPVCVDDSDDDSGVIITVLVDGYMITRSQRSAVAHHEAAASAATAEDIKDDAPYEATDDSDTRSAKKARK